ncbi:hypothetical protein AB0H83_12060 [Dactylosporangium sp. NPDC050688]|uniref:hypothetical protein n=1 Tax=Dactylosporangium sp. NPDC050688 TaxID=3157217 RepID=UPI0033E07A3A
MLLIRALSDVVEWFPVQPQIYLMGNPLLREPLAPERVKPRLLGHWGAAPGS